MAMSELRQLLEAKRLQALPPPNALQRLIDARTRRTRRRRAEAAIIALLLAGAGVSGAWIAFRAASPPAVPATPPWGSLVPALPTSYRLHSLDPRADGANRLWRLGATMAYRRDADLQAHSLFRFFLEQMPSRGWT